MFISLGLSGVVPVIHGLLIYGYRGLENRMSLKWVVISGVLYIIGAVLYAVWTRFRPILSARASSDSHSYAGLNGPVRAHMTFGVARTSSSTFSSSWRQRCICMAWLTPLTIAIP